MQMQGLRGLLGAEAEEAAPRPAGAGLAQVQEVSTAKGYTGSAVSADPLGLKEKSTTAPFSALEVMPSTVPQVDKTKSRKEQMEDFMAAQMPVKGKDDPLPASSAAAAGAAGASEAAGEKPGRLYITIQSSEENDKITWYTLLVRDVGKSQRTCRKRFNDFKEFDTRMRERSSVLDKVIPALPPAGTLGIRHKLGVGDFNQKRQEGLEQWLQSLAKNCKRQLVEDFLLKGDVTPSTQEALPKHDNTNHDEVEQWT